MEPACNHRPWAKFPFLGLASKYSLVGFTNKAVADIPMLAMIIIFMSRSQSEPDQQDFYEIMHGPKPSATFGITDFQQAGPVPSPAQAV